LPMRGPNVTQADSKATIPDLGTLYGDCTDPPSLHLNHSHSPLSDPCRHKNVDSNDAILAKFSQVIRRFDLVRVAQGVSALGVTKVN
ncbi:hypothetical protein L0F63_007242, partial [Massospora cicadina]